MPMGDLQAKYESFGWAVKTIDGNNMTEIVDALSWADANNEPTMILARTIPGK